MAVSAIALRALNGVSGGGPLDWRASAASAEGAFLSKVSASGWEYGQMDLMRDWTAAALGTRLAPGGTVGAPLDRLDLGGARQQRLDGGGGGDFAVQHRVDGLRDRHVDTQLSGQFGPAAGVRLDHFRKCSQFD